MIKNFLVIIFIVIVITAVTLPTWIFFVTDPRKTTASPTTLAPTVLLVPTETPTAEPTPNPTPPTQNPTPPTLA